MRKSPGIIYAIIALVLFGIGAFQGSRLSRLRDEEAFYRWMVSIANQARLFPDFHTAVDAEGNPTKDKDLFDAVATLSENVLGDIPVTDEDKIAGSDAIQPKIVRAVREGGHEDVLWSLAQSEAFLPPKASFLQYRREHKLMSLGTQFGLTDMYTAEGTVVSLSNMFFGFRKMAANLVWLEVDKHWHSGQMHRMIPLMNTATALDPNFVDAFLLGAWHLAYNFTPQLKETPEALKVYDKKYDTWVGEKEKLYYDGVDFLLDGIRKNPTNYKLYFDLGYAIYELKLVDHPNAVKYLSEAVKHRHDVWVRSTLYRCLQNNGQYEEALAGWEDYRKQFPGTNRADTIAPRFIDINQGLIFERDYKKAFAKASLLDEEAKQLLGKTEEARAQGNADEAARLERESEAKLAEANVEKEVAKPLREKARQTWESRLQKESDDVFAKCALHRMDAEDFARDGRYYEAIALLENARWEVPSFFEEASALIIEYKQKAKIPLTMSEQMAEIREEDEQRIHVEREKNKPVN